MMTKNKYKKNLISAAQAIEAHAFGEKVQRRKVHTGKWKQVPEDWNKADLMYEYQIVDS